jgi:O-methyltransferase
MLVELDAQGASDLALVRQTRALAPLLTRDAAALTILAWARSARRLGGDFAEAGVFMGGSARLICAAKGQAPLHLFDVFDTLRGDIALGPGEQAVRDYFDEVYAPLGQVRDLLSPYPEVHFHPGLFPRSAEAVADRRFAFVHLDLDRAQGTADALAFFHPRLVPGGVLIGDDYDLAPVRETFTAYFVGRSDALAVLPWGQVVVVKSDG